MPAAKPRTKRKGIGGKWNFRRDGYPPGIDPAAAERGFEELGRAMRTSLSRKKGETGVKNKA